MDVLAVGLGDDHDVGHLHDAALDALQLVAGTRNLQQHEHVDHRMYGRFGLSHADRFDEDDVESGSFAQDDRFAGFAGYAAERPGRRGGADEDLGIGRDTLHAGLVAEDRTAAALRAGVDGQYRQLVLERGDHIAYGFDEGRFSGSRDARDADAYRFPGMRQALFDDLLRLGIVVGVAAFYQGDGLRKRRDVALKNALDVLFGGECTLFLSDEIGIDYGLVFHTFGYGQGALVVGVGILFFVMVYLGE